MPSRERKGARWSDEIQETDAIDETEAGRREGRRRDGGDAEGPVRGVDRAAGPAVVTTGHRELGAAEQRRLAGPLGAVAGLVAAVGEHLT